MGNDFKSRKQFHYLNEILKDLKINYENNNIFGLFFSNDDEVCAVIIPTFESVCLKEDLINLNKNICGYDVKIIDIRYIYQGTKDGFPELINSLYTDLYIVNPKYEHMFNKLFKSNREIIRAGITNNNPAEELKIAVIKIMRTAFNENSKVIKFIKQLTDIEKTAIEEIIATVGDEGVFSQAKIASAAGISRTAMTNLVMKMQLSGVANINYLGNKGTYIKIIDDTLIYIRG